ncbi:hypothetical protein TNCV_1750821 [Trichonephila clavipes]|nr:hypothetical protein TNCV_1750821 [Trichonephila clavipes]
MVLKANDRRTSCPCHDEFRGPRSDYVRQFTIHPYRQLPPFCNSLNNFSAANLEPVLSSPSSNHKAAFQPFQDGLFHHFDFVSKCLIATPSLHVPTTNQVVPFPPRTATPSGTINNYDMGWRLALRAICPATVGFFSIMSTKKYF